jgi:glycosyltransferase involved in cell wall biosynthesis
MKMNILITSEFYYPRLGGAELVVQKLAEGLVGSGHAVTVATSYVEGQPSVFNGVSIESFRIRGNLARGICELSDGEVARYISIFRRKSFDIVFQYAAQTWHVDLILNYLGKEGFPPVILAPCGFSGLTTVFRKLLYYRYFKGLRSYLPKFAYVVPHSTDYIDYEFCIRAGVKNLKVIPNGIDVDAINKAVNSDRVKTLSAIGLPCNVKMVLTVSNHYKLKGHRWIKKLSELKEFQDVIFVIVGGDPGGRTSCYSQCINHSKRFKNFLVIGELPNQAALELIAASDVFLLLSDIECYPLSVLEALALNRAVITTNVGCMPSFSSQVKIVERNVQKIAHALRSALSTRGWADEMSHRNFVDRYSWSNIVKQYEQLFMSRLLR